LNYQKPQQAAIRLATTAARHSAPVIAVLLR